MTATALLLAALPLWWVDPYGDDPVLPESPPKRGVATNVLACAAARGEIETVSFAVRPAEDLVRVDFVPSDLTGPDGARIASACADLRLVKVWYRAGGRWGTSWCGNNAKPELIPDLVLHDDGLVRTVEDPDPAKRTILLRFSYPEGERYVDMRRHGGGESRFAHELHPVRDAPRFVPFDLKANRTQQYWLTWKVPADAAPGVYRGRLAVTADGRPLAELPLELEVYPFALPSARTHYDTRRPFIHSWMGVPSLAGELAHAKDLARAERKVRAVYRSLAEHNCHVPNGPGLFAANDPNDLNVRALALMREEGMRCDLVINGSAYDSRWCAAGPGAKFVPPEKDPAAFAAARARFAKTLDVQREVLDAWLGHHRCCFQSADECGTWFNRRSYPFWGMLRERGFEPWTDYAVAEDIGWSVGMNDVAAAPRHTSAWAWRTRGDARVVSYAGTFSGPASPDVWRRTKGLRHYYADFDGLHEYCFYYNRWNHWDDFRYRGSYAQMQIVYLTEDGLVPTLAWEGVREALDDIRYLSLLRLRCEAAIRSDDPAKRRLGRRHLAWMDAQDPEYVIDLFAFRREVAHRICELVRAVGPEPDEPPPFAAPKLPPCVFTSRLPADATPLARADEMARRDRYDLATKAYAAIRADEQASARTRFAATCAEARLLSEIFRRDEALQAIDATLERKDVAATERAELLLLRVRTMMTDRFYAESYSDEQLDAAGKVLSSALAKPGAAEERRFEALLRYVAACRAGGRPARGVAFADAQLPKVRFSGHRRGRILVETALCELDRKDDGAAAGRFRLAREACVCGSCLTRDVLRTEGALYERLQDYAAALTAYEEEKKRYDTVEEQPLIRRCVDRIARVMKRLRKSAAPAVPDADDPLDLD